MVKPNYDAANPPVLIPGEKDDCGPAPLRPRPRMPGKDAGGCCDPGTEAALGYMRAEAELAAKEGQRPNTWLGIGKAAGAHSLAAGPSVLDAATLKKKNVVAYFVASVADVENFLFTSFNFNGREMIQGAPVPLDVLTVDLNNRENMAHPIVGAAFDEDVTITASVYNVSAGTANFHNIAAAIYDPTPCDNVWTKDPKPAPGMVGHRRFFALLGRIWNRVFG
jgi:hypothetical protein